MLANFSVLPPEINSLLMFSGAGSGPMLAAATAWDGLASELTAAAASFGSVTSGLTSATWQGPASAAMAAAAAPYAGWLSAVAAQAHGAAGQARAVASAFEAARLATVHPAEVLGNRSRLVSLVSSNLFGQNAPAIAETEFNYERMWAQDVGALFGYHADASTAAGQLAPWRGPLSAAGRAVAGLAIPLPGNDGNLGLGNTGQGNTGFGNNGNANVGIANTGTSNFGFANSGNSNIGIGLSGNSRFGIGALNTGTGNIGLLNSGTGNIGFGNSGTNNRGLFNSGTGITGIFNMSLF